MLTPLSLERLAGGDLGDQEPSKPSTLTRTLLRALNVTIPTVIAEQVVPIRTTLKQPVQWANRL